MSPFADVLGPAQLLGYLAFALGVAAFLQRSDRRLKVLLAAESLAYAVHFAVLGNPTAAASAVINAARSGLSLRWRSRGIAVAAVAVYLAMGLALARGPAGWLPVVASSLGAIAVFTLDGIRMRLLLLVCTAMWLTNNVLSGSIGGTLLESFIAVASVFTLVRLFRAGRAAARAARDGAVPAGGPASAPPTH